MTNEPQHVITLKSIRKKVRNLIKDIKHQKSNTVSALCKGKNAFIKELEGLTAKHIAGITLRLEQQIEKIKAYQPTDIEEINMMLFTKSTADYVRIFQFCDKETLRDYGLRLKELQAEQKGFFCSLQAMRFIKGDMGCFEEKNRPGSEVAVPAGKAPDLSGIVRKRLAALPEFKYSEDYLDETVASSLPAYQLVQEDSVYIGQWCEGKRHGRGECFWSSGNYYIGDWRDDMKSGEGRLVLNTGDMYEGGFKENMCHGKGDYKWGNGNRYVGDFEGSKIQGYGEFTWVMEKEFKEGEREGSKLVKCKYVGEWKDNMKHGKGMHEDSRGIKIEGVWENNKLKKDLAEG